MKTAKVVIGAAFGDEGKGLMTDYLSNEGSAPIVVRFNGGPQAGHTVVNPDGERHVFSHFGSGSFVGAATYLSQFFMSNPLEFVRERDEFDKIDPQVFLHPEGLLITPFDQLLNQARDKFYKHGSCGHGINETVVRNGYGSPFVTRSYLINHPDILNKQLKMIRDLWVPIRLQQMNVEPNSDLMDAIHNPRIIKDYLEAAWYMSKQVIMSGPDALESRDVIFEGAQGLLLDEEHHFFPHVTRSKTGLKNVREISKEAGITDLDVFYMTRAYTTRHGNGPLPSFADDLSYEDSTNLPNPHQGTLRFGHLDLDLIGEAVQNDLRDYKNVTPHLIITHMDQMKDGLSCVIGGKLYENLKMQTFFDYCRLAVKFGRIGFSTGPTRNDITMVD